jgi:hypothetical protein
MKPLALCGLILVIACTALPANAQFKSQAGPETRTSGGVVDQSVPSTLFGWFDASKFSMHHTMSFSVMSIGGQAMTLGTYTNTMVYQFADNFDARADLSMSYSPGTSFMSFNGKTGNNFSGVYLSNAQLDYRPWDNFKVQLQYRQLPYGSYYSPFGGLWSREGGF